MYGIYYNLPLDYVGLIFDEMVNAVQANMKEQAGTKKKEGKNPKTFPKSGLPTKINRMKAHSPTHQSKGYDDRKPLSKVMLNYLRQ